MGKLGRKAALKLSSPNPAIFPVGLNDLFYRNTPMLASGIKGMRTKLRFGSELPGPLLYGGALDAPSACSAVRRRRFARSPCMGLIKVFRVVQELFLGLKSLD